MCIRDSDYTVEILLLDRNHVLLSLINKTLLRRRRYQIVDADRDSRASSVKEAQRLQIVMHLDGHLMSQTNVGIVHERLQALLFHRAIEERQTSGNRVVEDDSTNSGADYAFHILLNCGAQDVLRIVFLG